MKLTTVWKDILCVHYRKPSVNRQHELLLGSECRNWSDQNTKQIGTIILLKF